MDTLPQTPHFEDAGGYRSQAAGPPLLQDSLSVFERGAPAPLTGQSTQVEQARAIAEVRAAVMITRDRPRDTTNAIREMREVCQILGMADRAFYAVERGNEVITGKTVHLARELARIWGNIIYGVKELAQDDVRRQSELQAYAWDIQTNTYTQLVFVVPHARYTKAHGMKKIISTQDIYENNASFAGRRLRECIFNVLPVWFHTEAADICHHTLEHGGGKPLPQRIADLEALFHAIGIDRKAILKKAGRLRMEDMQAIDVANLGVLYKSITRNEISKEAAFGLPVVVAQAPAAAPSSSGPDDPFERAASGQPPQAASRTTRAKPARRANAA